MLFFMHDCKTPGGRIGSFTKKSADEVLTEMGLVAAGHPRPGGARRGVNDMVRTNWWRRSAERPFMMFLGQFTDFMIVILIARSRRSRASSASRRTRSPSS